jgi:hypothetical protein
VLASPLCSFARAVSFHDFARFDVRAIIFRQKDRLPPPIDLAFPHPALNRDLSRSRPASQNHRKMKLGATAHSDEGATGSADRVQKLGNCLKSDRNFAPISRLVVARVKTTPNAAVTE